MAHDKRKHQPNIKALVDHYQQKKLETRQRKITSNYQQYGFNANSQKTFKLAPLERPTFRMPQEIGKLPFERERRTCQNVKLDPVEKPTKTQQQMLQLASLEKDTFTQKVFSEKQAAVQQQIVKLASLEERTKNHTKTHHKLAPLERQTRKQQNNSKCIMNSCSPSSRRERKVSYLPTVNNRERKISHLPTVTNDHKSSDNNKMPNNLEFLSSNTKNCKAKDCSTADSTGNFSTSVNSQEQSNKEDNAPLITEQPSSADDIDKPQVTKMTQSEYSKQLKTKKLSYRKAQREKAKLFNIDLVDLHKSMLTPSAIMRGMVKLNASHVVIYRFRLSNYNLIDIRD